ncbi:hypothetical protein Pmar_PMAR018445, partial [Perkinsus marinus ATCC 50983]
MCKRKQRLLTEQRHKLEQDTLGGVKGLLSAKFAENHEQLRNVYKETSCCKRDDLREVWMDTIDGNSSKWMDRCAAIGERLIAVSDGTAEERENQKRDVDGSVGDAFLQKIEELQSRIIECSAERERAEQEWGAIMDSSFEEVRRLLSQEKGIREALLNGIRVPDAL